MSSTVTVAEIAATIDHAILKPELTRDDVDEQLALVARYGVFSACVRPSDVSHAYEVLEGSGVAVCAVIGFPHGTTSTQAKVAEAVQALDDGARELDMVLNIGRLRSGMLDDVEADIRAVVTVAGEHVVKVILETAYLNDDEIVAACRASERAGAAFVKTSTGFAGGGATVEHLRLMRSTVSDAVQVKASGGVRGLDTLLEMRDLGVTRFGTSATGTILDDVAARASGLAASGGTDETSY
ncbi:deoxyribose-phosphate aldolase [Aeromicrobium fastidiosum]|uniref:Deoxyribose-phosphate aldolase n=1 Tax=Aeromicrobium fastidiosum TaxID=52699 RepID=A0A641AIM9_9ACTN|nr:deoxyribose-phosphate aldolase [Aeromicrobium fastidiosum]KAA1374568.1 deoxyribose-phosphate aldolase [Aeromicrobium fastidiosum]MBP2390895.1 deoxyribose-phosphate aldolase [Aeromicrobium fastidiosum]